jgi:carboxyl-terminal processing protease
MLRTCSLVLVCLFTLPALGQEATSATVNLMKQAETAYDAKHFSESADLYIRALPLVQDSDRAGVEYMLARSQTLAGDRTSAFDALDHAVEDGYTNSKDIEADTNLVSLHTDPRWQMLLERMTLFTAQQDARWGDAAFATPYATNIADADKLVGLAELWAQAKFDFANFWHVPELNWDKTYRDFIPKVLATHSTEDYYYVLESFYALLRDGHTGVYPPEELNISPMPLRTRLVDGHLLILGTSRLGFNLQDLRQGDEILTINGEPAIAWAQRHVQPFVFASTQQDLDNRTFGNDLFRAPEGTSFNITTSTLSGTHASRTFTIPPWVASAHPLFELRVLPGNIVYIALNGFDDDTAAKEWDKHWPEISSATSVIIDLRENGGGNQSVGDHILATLIDRTAAGELSRSTRWIASYRAWGKAEVPLSFPIGSVEPDLEHHFSGPTALLISPRTFSAGEDMAVVFKQAHRGKIIGEPTGGSTGQPLMFKLPGGGLARICTKHDSFADGGEFVGVGIQPDIPIHLTRADIIAGRDSVLETAVHSLQTKP